MLAGSQCGGKTNVERTKERGIEVLTPAMGSQTHPIILVEWGFSACTESLFCPMGHRPQWAKTGKKRDRIVLFNKALCDACPQ